MNEISVENPYRSPEADCTAAWADSEPAFSFLTLFSFRGRMLRRWWWSVMLASPVALSLVISLVLSILAESRVADFVILTLAVPLMFWIVIAAHVRRLHDRGKSAWWLLMGFAPVVGPIWLVVELGCLRGTVGRNQYGFDPREAKLGEWSRPTKAGR